MTTTIPTKKILIGSGIVIAGVVALGVFMNIYNKHTYKTIRRTVGSNAMQSSDGVNQLQDNPSNMSYGDAVMYTFPTRALSVGAPKSGAPVLARMYGYVLGKDTRRNDGVDRCFVLWTRLVALSGPYANREIYRRQEKSDDDSGVLHYFGHVTLNTRAYSSIGQPIFSTNVVNSTMYNVGGDGELSRVFPQNSMPCVELARTNKTNCAYALDSYNRYTSPLPTLNGESGAAEDYMCTAPDTPIARFTRVAQRFWHAD